MTTRYQKRHYEDVATILRNEFKDWSPQYQRPIPYIAIAFANLFAADNPRRCFANEEHIGGCTDGCLTGTGPDNEGFDREQFLAACGLEAQPVSDEEGYHTHEHDQDFPECYGLEREG